MSFVFFLPNDNDCNIPDGFNEGVEFSIRFNGIAWIPIAFLVPINAAEPIDRLNIGDPDDLVIRGYAVDVRRVSDDGTVDPPFSVQICDFNEQVTSVQLRWLQSSHLSLNNSMLRDVWIIDDVEVSYENGARFDLLRDSFSGVELK